MRSRGLGDPLLVVSDGAGGIIKVAEDAWLEFIARVTASYQAPSRTIARGLADGMVADYEAEYPSAVGPVSWTISRPVSRICAYPIAHRLATRTTNLLKHLFVKERCHLRSFPTPSVKRSSSSS